MGVGEAAYGMPQRLGEQFAAARHLVGYLTLGQQVQLPVSMGMGAYLHPGRLEAGEVGRAQHAGWRKHAFVASPGESTGCYVERARQLPFGQGRHRVVGEVGEAVIHGDQHRPRRKLSLPAQAVSELGDGDGLPPAGYDGIKVSTEGGGGDGEVRDPVGRADRDGVVKEDGNRAQRAAALVER
jgi:hypothetical protein